MRRRRRKVSVVPTASGATVEITWDDGSTTTVRDELQFERIMRALRKPGKPYVHVRPR